MINKNLSAVFCLVAFLLISATAYGATAVRLATEPREEKQITVYAYKIKHLATLNREKPGPLVEIVKTIITDPEREVEVKVKPVNVLMKYGLIQSVGVAAIAGKGDFSAEDLKDLIEVPIYEKGGKKYSCFFNKRNPRGEPLSKIAIKNLKKIKTDGTYNQILKKYAKE